MASHTPGPWRAVDIRHQKNGQIRIFEKGRIDLIANVMAKNLCCDANASLIVTAPDLLIALKHLMDSAADVQLTFDNESQNHDMLTCHCKFCALNKSFKLAERTIAKAEGVSRG